MGTEISQYERRLKVWEMYIQGRSQFYISQQLGVAPSTVHFDLKEIPKEWPEKVRPLEEQRIIELQRLDSLEVELWEAWRRSQDDKEVVTVEESFGPIGQQQGGVVGSRTTTQRAGQVGDPRFLAEITKIIGLRCKILGLEAPTKILSIQIRWDLVSPEQVDRLSRGEEFVRVLEPSQYFYG